MAVDDEGLEEQVVETDELPENTEEPEENLKPGEIEEVDVEIQEGPEQEETPE